MFLQNLIKWRQESTKNGQVRSQFIKIERTRAKKEINRGEKKFKKT